MRRIQYTFLLLLSSSGSEIPSRQQSRMAKSIVNSIHCLFRKRYAMNIPSATAHAVTLIRLFTFIFRFSIAPLLCSAIQPSLIWKILPPNNCGNWSSSQQVMRRVTARHFKTRRRAAPFAALRRGIHHRTVPFLTWKILPPSNCGSRSSSQQVMNTCPPRMRFSTNSCRRGSSSESTSSSSSTGYSPVSC